MDYSGQVVVEIECMDEKMRKKKNEVIDFEEYKVEVVREEKEGDRNLDE